MPLKSQSWPGGRVSLLLQQIEVSNSYEGIIVQRSKFQHKRTSVKKGYVRKSPYLVHFIKTGYYRCVIRRDNTSTTTLPEAIRVT